MSSGPYPHEQLVEPRPLNREEQFTVDRLHALAAVLNDCQIALAPFANDEINKVLHRLHGLFAEANKLMSWGEFDRAANTVSRIEAAVAELRALGVKQGVNKLFFERVMKL